MVAKHNMRELAAAEKKGGAVMDFFTIGCTPMRALRYRQSLVLGVALLIVSVYVACVEAGTLGPVDGDGLVPTDLQRVKVGDAAPDFTLETESGTPITLSQFRDKKAVVLVFYRGHW